MKVLIILLSVISLLFGCVTMNPQIDKSQATKPQEVVIKIEAADTDKEVIVNDGKVYAPIPYMEGGLSHSSWINKDFENEDGSLGKGYIKLFSGLTLSDCQRFWNDVTYLKDTTNIRKIDLWLSSPGGNAFAGLSLADEIVRAQSYGFKFTVFTSGTVASAAVPVFAVCDYRIVSPRTIFMVHETSLWKWPGRETASDIRSQNSLMDLLREKYLSLLADHSSLDIEQWGELENKTTWFSSEQAKNWGLVDEIR